MDHHPTPAARQRFDGFLGSVHAVDRPPPGSQFSACPLAQLTDGQLKTTYYLLKYETCCRGTAEELPSHCRATAEVQGGRSYIDDDRNIYGYLMGNLTVPALRPPVGRYPAHNCPPVIPRRNAPWPNWVFYRRSSRFYLIFRFPYHSCNILLLTSSNYLKGFLCSKIPL